MKHIPESLIRTWIFLAKASDPKLANARLDAKTQLQHLFGSVELAIIYLEQVKDKSIEVVII